MIVEDGRLEAWNRFVSELIGNNPLPRIPDDICEIARGEGFRRLVHLTRHRCIHPNNAERIAQSIARIEVELWRQSWENPEALSFCGEGILFRDDHLCKEWLFIEVRRRGDAWAEHWRIETWPCDIAPRFDGIQKEATGARH